MCILAILYQVARNTPILVAANREEFRDRPTIHPKIQPGLPRILCGIDQQGGGTWLGVNQHGLFVTVANRRKRFKPLQPRSRGLLCREMLNFRTAQEAADYAVKQLATGQYAGANYLCADAKFAAVVYGGDEVRIVEVSPGLHTLSDGDLDNLSDERQEIIHRMLTLQKIDSAVTFLAVASRAFSRKPDAAGRRGIVLLGSNYGTVSSTLLALPRKIQQAVFLHSPGIPGNQPYEDLSALLRQVLSAGRVKPKSPEKPADRPAPQKHQKKTSPKQAETKPKKKSKTLR
jgi:hypothetical protein